MESEEVHEYLCLKCGKSKEARPMEGWVPKRYLRKAQAGGFSTGCVHCTRLPASVSWYASALYLCTLLLDSLSHKVIEMVVKSSMLWKTHNDPLTQERWPVDLVKKIKVTKVAWAGLILNMHPYKLQTKHNEATSSDMINVLHILALPVQSPWHVTPLSSNSPHYGTAKV